MAGADGRVNLIRIMDLLQEHITGAMCQAVFRRVRVTERQRKWTLEALVEFWMAVILRSPAALSQALQDNLDGRGIFAPRIHASPEAFFQRCRDLRSAFFAEVFRVFTERIVKGLPERYATSMEAVQAGFTAVMLIDGSRVAAIARRLKILRRERAVILPGCLLAMYDLGRGVCRHLYFHADAAASEMTRAKAALADLQAESLVLGDRLYCTADFFAALASRRCWGLFRRNRTLGLRVRRHLSKRQHLGGLLEDSIVEAGSGQRTPSQTLRYIRWRHGRQRYELLTNVLDVARLSAPEGLALYPYRWGIERMFFDLKEVLNLNRVYAANPNAVAMQVFAAAIVYNAMRVAQGEVAAEVGLQPEELSPAKLFPKIAAAHNTYLAAQLFEQDVRRANRGRHVVIQDWRRQRWASVPISSVCVEVRRGPRRSRRFCAARRHWKSLAHVSGGRRLVRLS
jgi:hypothetical protein